VLVDDARIQEAVTEAVSGKANPRRVIEIGTERDRQSGVLRFTVRPIPTEGGALALVVVEDVTQQRVAVAARDSFLAQATHELRSPLTSIRLYVEKALEDTEISPGEVAQSLNVVNEESRRLERVVSEILSVSEIEAGSFHLERDDVELNRVLQQLQADHLPQAQKKKVHLVFDLPPKLPTLQADRDKIAVALHNLVGNAVKYTPSGGTVTVRAEVDEGQVRVVVEDSGLGIKPEEQERIFEKFYRAKDRRIASIAGSGLGLAISREVIRLHGGDITVTSAIDQGSTFTLSLPIPQEVTEVGNTNSTVRRRKRG
jgi:signal transduction histidine kinase